MNFLSAEAYVTFEKALSRGIQTFWLYHSVVLFFCDVFEEYGNYGIENPENPNEVCKEIEEKTGIPCMIVDANDLGQEILGKSSDLTWKDEELKALIKDNPAGQGKECTPLILIREKDRN